MKSRIIASLLALVLLVGALSGCGKKADHIATLNGEKIPIGYYTTQMLIMRAQYENYYGDDYSSFMAAANETDPSMTNAQVLDNSYIKAFETLYMFKLKVEELGLKLDDFQEYMFEEEYTYFKSLFRSEGDFRLFLSQAGMTEAEHKEIYKISTFYPDLLRSYFFNEDTGVQPYTEEEVRAFFDEYVDYSIKHILFWAKTTGDDGNALSEAEINANFDAAKAQAESVLAEIKGGRDFDDAMNELSADADLAKYPDGYGFVENEEHFPICFTTAVKELEVGGMGVYKSDFGYHIILRTNIETYYTAQRDTYEEAMVTEILTGYYTEWTGLLKFEYNEKALTQYSFASKSRTNVNLRSQ